MIKNILHYRHKQGKFRHPEDFRKIYGLTEEQYQTLHPYIQITEDFSSKDKDTIRLLTVQSIQRDTLVKYQPGTVVSLNSADTTELKKIPGVGSSIARMIVNYRERLGGFCRIEQLQEIHLKAERLRPWFSIDTHQIHRINLNKAGMERMMRHPYINYYQAKVIIEYRKKKGILKSLKQLSLMRSSLLLILNGSSPTFVIINKKDAFLSHQTRMHHTQTKQTLYYHLHRLP